MLHISVCASYTACEPTYILKSLLHFNPPLQKCASHTIINYIFSMCTPSKCQPASYLARPWHQQWSGYATVYKYVTRFAKTNLVHTSDKAHFSPPINCYTNELTIHVYTIANNSLVCFSWGCFLRPVWWAQVLGWSSNGSGVNRQVFTQLEIATWLARRLGHQVGYCLWYLEFKWATGGTFWQCQLQHMENPSLPWLPTTPYLHPYMIII